MTRAINPTTQTAIFTVYYDDSHNASGSSSHNDTDDERNERLAVFEVAISATILFLAVAGNSVVVVSLMVKRGKLSRMHLMMLHLSLADLSVAFFSVLPQMVWDITFRFQGGAFLCVAVKYLQLVTMYASPYVLLSTAVDRYVAICRPFLSQKWTSRHAHILVLTAWVASLVFSIPQVFIFSLREVDGPESGVYDCWATFQPPWTLQLYITWNAFSIFIVPVVTLAVLYGHISHAVWKSSKMAETLAPRYVPNKDHHRHSHGPTDSGRKACISTSKAATAADHGGCSSASAPAIPTSGRRWRPGKHGGVPYPSDPSNDKHRGSTRTRQNSAYQSAAVPDLPVGGGDHARHDKLMFSCDSRSCRKQPGQSGGKRCRQDPTQQPSSSGTDTSSSATLLGSSRHKSPSHAQQGQGSGRSRSGGGAGGVGISRAKIKTIKLTLTVVICYLVCWTPYYVAQLWAAYDENVPYESIFFTLVLLLASVNSCTNPWIYMAFSDTICNILRAVASPLCCRRRRSSQCQVEGDKGRYRYTHSATFGSTSSASATYRSVDGATNGVSRL